MNKATTNILLMLITIIAGTWFFITCCSECSINSTQEPPEEKITVTAPVKSTTATYPFSVNQGDFAYSTNDNYNFNVSSTTPNLPLSDDLNTGISQLANHLNNNGNQVVDVTGYYMESEENNTVFPNLGLARANAIKNDLASKGIATSQITTAGKIMPDMTPNENVLMGAAGFNISEKSADLANEMAALRSKIQADPLIFYFNSASASISLNSTQRQKIFDINRYLDAVDGAMVQAIGHTDSQGAAASNLRLGLNRANFAKEYLTNNGISAAKIETSSKGETAPVATNATAAGRVKNRRTVITLK